MIIFPAIDIKDSKCVRLLKGDFKKITSYRKTPLDQAKEFFKVGFKNVHVVDLDGALHGKPINSKIIKDIIKKSGLKIQIGGGIRNIDSIREWLEIGADKIVMGTSAVKNIGLLRDACKKFKNKIVMAMDIRNGLIALAGWKKQTNISALDFVKEIENFGVSRIIYTDINRDGTKKGPNVEDVIKLSIKVKIPFIISGGIASIEDVKKIKMLSESNIQGVIIGKAIYDGNIEIRDLIKLI